MSSHLTFSSSSLQNLLKAVGESAEHTKDVSQTKLVEAKMRADLLHVISERDAAHKDSMVAQRRVELLSNDVANLKTEKTKLQHDKLRLEREVRSARALADGLSSSLLSSNNSGNHHHRDDLDYYKGKAKELETHLQGMTARMAEKNKEIQELRRCNDRNWSQQRLQTLKAAQEPSISTSDRVRKHPRHSY
jgi:polyhydroxyalkanoate synthesis regulator phasin